MDDTKDTTPEEIVQTWWRDTGCSLPPRALKGVLFSRKGDAHPVAVDEADEERE